MLSRLLNVRLKAAERALKDGRYDEAFRMATEPDIRAQRRGAAVLQRLTGRFLDRARAHFKADRYAEALLDLTKAEAGGTRKEEIAELREQVQAVAAEELRKENSRKLRLEAARRRIEAGSLAAGQRILEDVSQSDPVVQDLRQVAENRQEDATDKLAAVEQLLGQGQVRAAVEALERARSLAPHSTRVADLASKLTGRVLADVRASLTAGRVQRAADELGVLGGLSKDLPERRELESAIEQVAEMGGALARNRFENLRQDVMRLAHLLPEAEWVRAAADQVRQLDELLVSLRAGPLGHSAGLPAGRRVPVEVGTDRPRAASLKETVRLAPAPAGASTLPTAMLLLIDGGGSFLLHRGGRVSVGRAAAREPADVPIFSDLSERHAEIAYVDDDYFLFAAREVEVGGRRTRHQLLRNGDRVVFGRRAKFTFRQPTRKSGSAVLEMSDSTRLPNDVRRVVLLRQTATIGFGPAVHVSCSGADREILLFERAGQLWVRPQPHAGVASEARPVALGQPMQMCGIGLVVEPWQIRGPGRPLG